MNYPYYGYQPMYTQPVPDQLTQMKYNQSTDERIWVQGQNAAEAYLVAPNGFVRLWDSSKPVFYEKRADSVGRPFMESYEYTRKDADTPKINPSMTTERNTYADEINGLKSRLDIIENKLKEGNNDTKSDANDTAV